MTPMSAYATYAEAVGFVPAAYNGGSPSVRSAKLFGRVAGKTQPRQGPNDPDATATSAALDPADSVLVAAAAAGDHRAKHALFQRHAPMVNRLARRLMGPGVDANDLAQDAFVEALRGIRRLKNRQAFQAWLCAIVVRTAQKVRRRRRLLERLGLLRQQPLDLDGFCSRSAPPDVAAELRAIYDLLHSLPVEVHIALVLRRVEGLAVDEIAEQMRLSVSTVKRRLAVAAAHLDAWRAAKEGPA